MDYIIKTTAIALTASLLIILGAYLHERDIQRACNQDHRTGDTTWITELYCVPADNLGNRYGS